MAKSDSFICPRCGKETVEAVQQWEHDFFAVHEVKRAIVTAWHGGKVECSVLTKTCSAFGEKIRIDIELVEKKIITKKIQKPELKGLF